MSRKHGVPTLADLPPQMILDPTRKDVEPRAGMGGFTRMYADRKAIDQAERTIEFVCSTNVIDRYGEVVEPSAFADSLDDFVRFNPAFPFGHSYEYRDDDIPAVGRWVAMRIEGDRLLGTAWFRPEGKGERCWRGYLDGSLNCVSVAFLTQKWEMRDVEIDGQSHRVRVFTKADLIEVSAVLIPANPQARLRAASWGGIGGGAAGGSNGLQSVIESLSNTVQDLRAVVGAAADRSGLGGGWDDGGGDGAGSGSGRVSEGERELQGLLRSALSAAHERE